MARSVSRVTFGSRGSDLVVVSITAVPERRKAESRGPVVVITANVHGDECTGTGAVLRLIPLLEAELVRGTVHLYPSLNPDGLERRARRVPEDDQDLNRLFPGDPQGSPAERLAYAAWTDIEARHPDLLIDLHADSPGAVPYALLDRATSLRGEARSRLEGAAESFARATGLTVIHEYPDDRYQRFRLDRSLTGAALNRLRVPAVTVEAGPRLVLDANAVDVTLRAVLGCLRELGMVDGPAAAPSGIAGTWRRESGPRVSTAGVLVPRAPAGVLMERGAVVAEVRSLASNLLEEVVAESRGFVLAPAERAHVVAGVAVCTWALAESS
ncbi:hypothetical protein LBMAG42_22890 [Deltaproteobacteria bacterium]|nr:hypothetical protein LBMAG42_22890 [Deltaproteobacteria bacterium]